jgi:hypothetical protein
VNDSEESLSDRMIEDARAAGYADGYARGAEAQRRASKIPLALMADELRMMPPLLVDAYMALCISALADGTEGRRGEELRVAPKARLWRTNTNTEQTRGVAKATGKKGSVGGPTVKNARLLALKTSIDRKLRKIAREIESRMEGGTGMPARKCSRCGKYGEDNWIWCPYDSAVMQSEDRT